VALAEPAPSARPEAYHEAGVVGHVNSVVGGEAQSRRVLGRKGGVVSEKRALSGGLVVALMGAAGRPR
jgi:hypothetical protein